MMRWGNIAWFLALALLLAFITAPDLFTFVFAPLTEHNAPPIYNQGSLLSLTLSHLLIVFGAAFASTIIAVSLGIFVTRPSGVEFLPLSRSLVNIGQTFPPIAVLAVAVPLVGFGETPTFIALFLYGLLPIFENTLSGITQVSPLTLEAAKGMGMSPRGRLFGVELPLALPVILAGIRLSIIINLGTATIGSTVAAKGLGEVIIAGLQSNNLAFVLQGGLVVALLAILIHGVLTRIERSASARLGGRGSESL
ncbi:ABC transporter permease [Microvirga brassicacearum]|uniref:ABC transporter permease n=1 Tax=Microvirga brassicacearum TaxID=2580413 RepID=A0A5N3P9J3_9HYPH|nr:ABC transporter permease [Microvirga brassicacearum]KAB0266400.1 ABC transporter permease [Microvirga brassicacearum]